MKCRNPNKHPDDELCFCPKDPNDIRSILKQTFINGWLHPEQTKRANALASDPDINPTVLGRELFELEDRANDNYGMWRNTL